MWTKLQPARRGLEPRLPQVWKSDTESFFEEFGLVEPRWLGGSSPEVNTYRLTDLTRGEDRVVKVFGFAKGVLDEAIESTSGPNSISRQEVIKRQIEDRRKSIRAVYEFQNGLDASFVSPVEFLRDDEEFVVVRRNYHATSFAQLIDGKVELHDADLLNLADKVLSAYEQFQDIGEISHGNIKPGNILFDGEPSEGNCTIRFTDFSMEPDAAGVTGGDLESLGRSFCEVIERKRLNEQMTPDDLIARLNGSNWPWLGTSSDDWLILCRSLLEGNLGQAKVQIERLNAITSKPRRYPAWKRAGMIRRERPPVKRGPPAKGAPIDPVNPEFSIPGAFLPKEPGAEAVPERGLWELLGEPQGEGLDSDAAASGQADYHPFRPGFDSAAFDGLNAATTITQLIALLEEESEDKREIVRFAEKSIGELPLHTGLDDPAVCEGLERLSALGILKADFTLGRVYDGQGNRTKAIEFYEKAYFRDSSPPSALLRRLGELYLEGERDQEVWGRGVAMILQAHRQGDFRATFKLGLCLQKGRGVGLDEVQGYQLVKEAWKRSLREEDPYYPARVQMAECLFRGKGIVADPEKGFHYLLDAAENGRYPRAIENLILCFRNGWGTKPDPESAVTWASRLNELQ